MYFYQRIRDIREDNDLSQQQAADILGITRQQYQLYESGKLKNGFMLRTVGGQQVVVAVGEASKSFNGIIRLNETGALLWNILSEGADEEKLLAAMLEEYDIDESRAEADIAAFIAKLNGADILE